MRERIREPKRRSRGASRGTMRIPIGWLLVVVSILPPRASAAQIDLFKGSINDEAIQYAAGDLQNPVALLQQRIDRGEARLEFNDKHGYLESVLQQLKVPVSSQVLVFSKTSLQVSRISPQKPRAIYFNDDVYVGYVQHGVLEISVADARKGAVFYTLAQRRVDKPQFVRGLDQCLQCHLSVNTMKVPGFLVRSVFADSAGEPLTSAGSFLTDHRSLLSERWGGWYVTGTHGEQRHMGNVVVKSIGHPERLDRDAGANVTDLKGRVNTTPYLSPHSDLVALMVLEHQTRLHTLITRVAYEARLEVKQNAAGGSLTGGSELPPQMEGMVEALLRYLLFAEEAPMAGPMRGTSNFQTEFEALGPKDSQGRSLRQMDMTRRMFKYPCSYLIYSEDFDTMPGIVKARLYWRLWEALSGADQSQKFAALSPADRRAVLEILLETKPGLPDYFRGSPKATAGIRP
jgi:hypothetical protein